ncbi:hypothetical protein F2Q70_00009607 [Brassica cretica]|uniref:CRC domain-containing protein n=1 Tax=Brassica cretica TaxID=69181 RepID=A0A8S9LY71_BRACR|nr:hypothetical protein F2Q70_00009607 [Brassica cretica]
MVSLEESNKTPASARHMRGCNCKKSGCSKKYCECYLSVMRLQSTKKLKIIVIISKSSSVESFVTVVTVVTVLVSFVFYSFVFSYGCCEFVLESKPSIELLKQVTKDNKMTLIWTILARTEHYHLDFVQCRVNSMACDIDYYELVDNQYNGRRSRGGIFVKLKLIL